MIERSLESIAASLAGLLALAVSTHDGAQPTPTPEKVKPEKAKPEKVKPEPEKAKAEARAEIAARAEAGAPPVLDYEPLKASVIALANHSGEGKAAAINLLSKFGVKKAAEIPSEKWAAAQAAFEAELALLNGETDEDFA
jgi:ABC-type transport system involved in cytochrome bd biosynthesis fused ATPase/permease subunit